MSEDDYKAGLRGHEWSPMMDRQSYEAGESKRKATEDIMGAGAGPKTEVSGPGLVGVIMAPILALMYPTAGLVVSAAIVSVFALTNFLPKHLEVLRILLLIATAILALILALKAEHAVSNFKPYRIFRHIFRLIAVGSITFGAIIGVGPNTTFEKAFNNASGGAIFGGLVAIALMHFIFPMLDRVFFPVMDDRAKRYAIKYAGKSEEEIFAIKNAIFHGILRFAGAWLAGTIALMFLMPKMSVFLLAVCCFGLCWMLRNRLFFKSPAQPSSRPA